MFVEELTYPARRGGWAPIAPGARERIDNSSFFPIPDLLPELGLCPCPTAHHSAHWSRIKGSHPNRIQRGTEAATAAPRAVSSPTQLCTRGRPRELPPFHAIQAHADARRLGTHTAANHSTRTGRTRGRQPNHTQRGGRGGHSGSYGLLASRRIRYARRRNFQNFS